MLIPFITITAAVFALLCFGTPSNMLLLALALVGLVGSRLAEKEFVAPIKRDYHTAIGIPLAARIKAAEEAPDFDDARIVGGAAVYLGKYPYFGGVLIELNTGDTSLCGSSLVFNNRVVTAAHCVRSNDAHAVQFTVVLGSVRLYSGGTRRTTSNSQVHENYSMDTFANDIAMISFEWVDYTENIYSVSLACGTSEFVDTWAYAVGFGLTSDNAGIASNQFLSDVRVQVINNTACRAVHGSDVLATNICIDTHGKHATCHGDSGGPLVAYNLLIGISSFGDPFSCEQGQPDVFIRVTAYTTWILAHFS